MFAALPFVMGNVSSSGVLLTTFSSHILMVSSIFAQSSGMHSTIRIWASSSGMTWYVLLCAAVLRDMPGMRPRPPGSGVTAGLPPAPRSAWTICATWLGRSCFNSTTCRSSSGLGRSSC